MTERDLGRSADLDDDVRAIDVEALIETILPALITRLRASRLGELEVRSAGWRIRLRREVPESDVAATPIHDRRAGDVLAEPIEPNEPGIARSPAVGYFNAGPALAEGHAVLAGDVLGWVDVLGVRQEVPAPLDGIISGVLVEDDQAVEYGQSLAHIDALGLVPGQEDRAMHQGGGTAA